MTSLLKIGGMTCQNCARHVREALQEVPGVEYAEVDLDQGRARVKSGETRDFEVGALVAAVGRAGYSAEEQTSDAAPAGESSSATSENPRGLASLLTWKFNVIFSLAVAAGLMAIDYLLRPAMGGWFGWLGWRMGWISGMRRSNACCGRRWWT